MYHGEVLAVTKTNQNGIQVHTYIRIYFFMYIRIPGTCTNITELMYYVVPRSARNVRMICTETGKMAGYMWTNVILDPYYRYSYQIMWSHSVFRATEGSTESVPLASGVETVL